MLILQGIEYGVLAGTAIFFTIVTVIGHFVILKLIARAWDWLEGRLKW